ncbi:MAG: hypothetical protein WCO86_15535, partial [Planctomycetota bacterium]
MTTRVNPFFQVVTIAKKAGSTGVFAGLESKPYLAVARADGTTCFYSISFAPLASPSFSKQRLRAGHRL